MICFNRIVTVWFALVSVIVSNSLFEIEPSELKTVLLKSMQKKIKMIKLTQTLE